LRNQRCRHILRRDKRGPGYPIRTLLTLEDVNIFSVRDRSSGLQ
jgi:hypothetical protein